MRRFVVVLFSFGLATMLMAEETQYQQPPPDLAALVDQPRTPDALVSPDKTRVVFLDLAEHATVEELSRPELKLAGLRFDPQSSAPSSIRRRYSSMSFCDFKKRLHVKVIGLPETAVMAYPKWSPDSKWIAVSVLLPTQIDLYKVDSLTGVSKLILAGKLNGVMGLGSAYTWLPDSSGLVCRSVPDDRGSVPDQKIPLGPIIRQADGVKSPARTYQDLLSSPADEDIFSYYVDASLLLVSLSGDSKKLGPRAMIHRHMPSPDGQYLLVEMIHKPFSHLVPYERFPNRIEIWDISGRSFELLVDQPLAENMPKGFNSVRVGMRELEWRPDVPASLTYVEAMDNGDAMAEAEFRDQVFLWEAPFSEPAKSMIKLKNRFYAIDWTDKGQALVHEWWWASRQVATWLTTPGVTPQQLWQRSYQDSYSNPGAPMKAGTAEHPVIHTLNDGKSFLLAGDGASPKGDYPFVDEYNLQTLTAKRLWQCESPNFEFALGLADLDGKRIVTRSETIDGPPNYYTRGLKRGRPEALTAFPHPTPGLRNIHKELVQYTRDDGVALNGTLYLPPGYQPDQGPLPTLMWAYPQEFKNAADAGQITDSPHRFVSLSPWGPMPFLAAGYAVFDNPSMPIVGEDDTEPNDSFIKQLVANAQAAIDVLVAKGVTDRERVAIGGHSYGAFMTANLMAHSDLFRTGIARSGSYNRTLTPFGFQSEQRLFWEAPEVYGGMSPFFHADKINEPLLLIHGEADNNPGTFPMQSERLFNAMKGLGGQARLVMLPMESHGYRARESLLHMVWEEYVWLDKFLKSDGSSAE